MGLGSASKQNPILVYEQHLFLEPHDPPSVYHLKAQPLVYGFGPWVVKEKTEELKAAFKTERTELTHQGGCIPTIAILGKRRYPYDHGPTGCGGCGVNT